jgi:hypothetical protein
METIFPKDPQDVQVRVTYQLVSVETPELPHGDAIVTLNSKLYEYVVRIEGAITSVIVELFTKGKVRVDFGHYVERLELVNKADCLSGPDAIRLFENFVAKIEKTGIKLKMEPQTITSHNNRSKYNVNNYIDTTW